MDLHFKKFLATNPLKSDKYKYKTPSNQVFVFVLSVLKIFELPAALKLYQTISQHQELLLNSVWIPREHFLSWNLPQIQKFFFFSNLNHSLKHKEGEKK